MDTRTRQIWEDDRVPPSAKKGQFYAHLTDDLMSEAYELGCWTEMGQTEFLKRLIKIAQERGSVKDIE